MYEDARPVSPHLEICQGDGGARGGEESLGGAFFSRQVKHGGVVPGLAQSVGGAGGVGPRGAGAVLGPLVRAKPVRSGRGVT